MRNKKTGRAAGSDSAGFAIHSTRRTSEPDLAASGFKVSEVGCSVRARQPYVMNLRHAASERVARIAGGRSWRPTCIGSASEPHAATALSAIFKPHGHPWHDPTTGPRARMFSLHDLRRTFVSDLLDAGPD